MPEEKASRMPAKTSENQRNLRDLLGATGENSARWGIFPTEQKKGGR
jgi:hypothetical protein